MKKKMILLTDAEIKTLKEALLCAEVVRDKECAGAGKPFEELHKDIDEQIERAY